MNVSIATFNRARSTSESALETIHAAAKHWLTEEIIRQAQVKLMLGDAVSANDKITVKLDIPAYFTSPSNMSPAALLSDDNITIAANHALFALSDSITGNTGMKISRTQPGLGGRVTGIGFTIVIDTAPF